jgi:hypothetical protein
MSHAFSIKSASHGVTVRNPVYIPSPVVCNQLLMNLTPPLGTKTKRRGASRPRFLFISTGHTLVIALNK